MALGNLLDGANLQLRTEEDGLRTENKTLLGSGSVLDYLRRTTDGLGKDG
ncbi:hypothetical protein V7150_22640 [Neobacillus drentensis]